MSTHDLSTAGDDRWLPDTVLARRFLAERGPPGTLLLCGITGAHHYGFPSADSDIDMKGIHLAPTAELLGLDPPAQTHDRLELFDGVECDLTSHEAMKALNLLLAGNGNMLERILSPFQVADGESVAQLQNLARGAISKRFAKHYRGFFIGMRREHATSPEPGVKSLLYSYRVALTGIHLLRKGVLEANITRLAPLYGFPAILDLVDYKRSHAEKAALPDALARPHRERWDELAGLLDQAIEHSELPEQAPNRDAISAWLVEQRMKNL